MALNPSKLSILAGIVSLMLAGTGCGLVDTIQARQLAREGYALYLVSDYRGAIQKYKDALALEPDCPNLHLNLGYSYFSIYDPAGKAEGRRAAVNAVRAFQEHLHRHPQDEKARIFQIKTLLKAAPHNPELADTAHQTFLEMLRKNPDDHEARQYLITLFIEGRRYENAVSFFAKELEKNPKNIETMKILAIIADKSDRIQEAVDWYYRRAEATEDPEKKALLYYEVGTYAWNLLHYQPNRATGVEAIKLVDQGIQACRRAMQLKEKYAEAMVYANLLYLKRALYETEEVARSWDQSLAFEFRVQAGKILGERKKKEQAEQEKDQAGSPKAGTGSDQKKEG